MVILNKPIQEKRTGLLKGSKPVNVTGRCKFVTVRPSSSGGLRHGTTRRR